LCRPSDDVILLLTEGSAQRFPHVRRRIVAAWHDAWGETGHKDSVPEIVEQRTDLVIAADGAAFRAAVKEWLGTS
jgi:hypothetical protein